MTYQGRFHNGVVVLEGGAELAEGTPVTVSVESSRAVSAFEKPDLMTEEEHHKVVEIIDRIASLPIEGSHEPFSGADHDKVLYGKPY